MKVILLKILLYSALTLSGLLIILSVIPYFFSLNTQAVNLKPFENSQIFKTEGVNIHFQHLKNDTAKTAIIFVHGFSGSTFSWRNNVHFFHQKGFEILAVDLPAFGFSDRNLNLNHSAQQRAKWLWNLCDSLSKDKKWLLVGHSMGATVVSEMANVNPDKTYTLVMVDGVSDMGMENNGKRKGGGMMAWLLKYPPITRWAELVATKKFYTEEKFVELLSSAYSRTATKEEARGYLAPFLLPQTTSAILSSFSNSQSKEKKTGQNYTGKILLLWGTEDEWVNISTAENFLKKNPKSSFVKIENAGHCPMETHPDIFNEEVFDFLQKQ